MSTVQLVYASTASFGDGRIETPQTQREVFNIVRRSRANNPGWGVVGALLFGDGHFLQVLEGDDNAVDRLFEVLQQDARHRDLQVLRRNTVDEPVFARWSMKFPTMDEGMREILGLNLSRSFDPYRLDDDRLNRLVAVLADDPELA